MFGRDLRRAQWLGRWGNRIGSAYRNYGPGSTKFAIGGSAAGLGRSYIHAQRKSIIKRKMQRSGGSRASKKRKVDGHYLQTKHEPQGDGSTYSVVRKSKSFVPYSVLQSVAPNHMVISPTGQQLATTVGVANIASYDMLSNTDLTTMVGKLSVGGTTAYNMFIVDAKMELFLKSASTFSAVIKVYDCIPRRDATANTATPVTAWVNGITDELSAGAATNVGNTPYMSDLFNLFWEVKKETTFDLLPGASHRHTVYSEPNMKIHNELLANITGPVQGLTVHSMIVLQGGPAHDSTTKTQISTAAASIDIVKTVGYNFKFLQDNGTNYYKTNGLPTSFTVGAEVMNEELGELQNAAGLTATAGVY